MTVRGRRRPGRTALGALLGLAVAVAGLTVAPAAQAARDDSSDKIRPGLQSRLAAGGEADFWVRFDSPADLSGTEKIKDWDKRGAYVVKQLKANATSSQTQAVAALKKARADYESYWATNAVFVHDGSEALAETLAAQSGVSQLWPSQTYGEVEPVEPAGNTTQAVEWGVSNIKADQVWSELGVEGEGIVIANIDSGVQYDHPALVAGYRGNNGDGTFTHDYNWFDTSGGCSGGAPCDTNGHGTHTMGTMTGSDGGDNRIGVAPGAKWITANGCDTCSDADLIQAGQWMLAPTRTDGTDADPSKRPHIINNSWGSQVPSNDPFMEDLSAAWTAAGIFGVWSNGNNGPSCQTSGSPGSRTVNYSVGAYDSADKIASFSSRGTGQSGAVKPDVSAPGVNIRSSLPGSGYGTASGTSMAAPHVAGAIALLWSAAPALAGDVEATRALVDGSAIDTADTQCGGTADDNNVYGEGRLDALALIRSADLGPTGTLTGLVTDGASGKAVEGAEVRVAGGPTDKTVTVDGEGRYEIVAVAGDYEVTASAFGYRTRTESVTVTEAAATQRPFELTAYPASTVTGTVTDGSGQGWPLYTRITVADVPDGVYYTDPVTGTYSVSLPEGTSYSLSFTPVYPGYETRTETVALDAGNVTRDLAVGIDPNRCAVANGYRYSYDGTISGFDGGTLPAGWSIVDHIGTGGVWRFDDPYGRGNHTGGQGDFVSVDSDFYDWGNKQDTSLVMPVMDLSDQPAPVIGFNQDYNDYQTEIADVDLSLDGGTTWTNVLRQTEDVRGPRFTSIPIPQAAGKPNVRVRFHYYKAEFDWVWQLDNVFVGTRSCDTVPGGGYLTGNVLDANTGKGVDGATVTVGGKSPKTAATPADDELADGFYWTYLETAGEQRATAAAANYAQHVKQVDVSTVTRADFGLKAGRLAVEPAEVTSSLVLGDRTDTRTFTVTNTGTAPAGLKFGEGASGFVMQRADGQARSLQQIEAAEGAPLRRNHVPVSLASTIGQESATADPAADGPQAAPWTDIADYPQAVMDNTVVRLDGRIYSIGGVGGGAATAKVWVYDPATLAWTQAAPLPATRNAMTAGVIDGQIVASSGWGDNGPDGATWIYDPDDDAWTAAAANPAPRAAAGQAVLDGRLYAVGGCTSSSCVPTSNTTLAYDPSADTWKRLANYPVSVAFASCGALGEKVVCTGGSDGTTARKATYTYDPAEDTWTEVADAPIDTWAAAYAVANGELVVAAGVQAGAVSNASYAYNADTDTWRRLPNANTARYRGGAACGFYKIGGSSGGANAGPAGETLPGFGDCAGSTTDTGWMSVDLAGATLEPGQKVTVAVTLDGRVDQPGSYGGAVRVREDTPYAAPRVPVTFTVTPPHSWGKLAGVVRGTACETTTPAPLEGAVVAVDSALMDWTFRTRADGSYAYWIDKANNPLTVIAAKDGYRTQGKPARIVGRDTTTVDFDLTGAGC